MFRKNFVYQNFLNFLIEILRPEEIPLAVMEVIVPDDLYDKLCELVDLRRPHEKTLKRAMPAILAEIDRVTDWLTESVASGLHAVGREDGSVEIRYLAGRHFRPSLRDAARFVGRLAVVANENRLGCRKALIIEAERLALSIERGEDHALESVFPMRDMPSEIGGDEVVFGMVPKRPMPWRPRRKRPHVLAAAIGANYAPVFLEHLRVPRAA